MVYKLKLTSCILDSNILFVSILGIFASVLLYYKNNVSEFVIQFIPRSELDVWRSYTYLFILVICAKTINPIVF